MAVQQDAPVQAEVIVLTLRRHGRVLTLPVLLLLVLAAAGGYFVGSFAESWMNWAAGLGGAALALVLGIGPLMSWLANRTTVTNRRVIVRRGFFVQRRIEVPLSRVREVRSRRGPLQRMFGSGDVELVVGADPATVLKDVPAPLALVDALQELIERNYLSQQAELQV
ncbi:MAG: PH domain-containing protein [Leucobacter sp.]|nr:PH domain-containing protein [Leucobacter sp.]